METLELPQAGRETSGAELDELLETVPEGAAVFSIFADQGEPYLARTSQLRRRLKRLLGPNARVFSLRTVARRLEWELTGSRLDGNLSLYEAARRHFPANYARYIRLRPPSYLKLLLSNQFPRSQVTSRLTGGEGRFFGPFRTRAAAEAFEAQFLDLFQLRRCPEDLAPAVLHPGCIYGEMNLCLRPCQMAVTPSEYLSEVRRAGDFLATNGGTLLDTIAAARDRASEELEFEEAQRQHRRFEKVTEVLKLRDELAHDLSQLRGLAVLPAPEPGFVRLRPFFDGWWQAPINFSLAGAGQSMDARLRDVLDQVSATRTSVQERNDHTALLAQWFYSTWRDGEWLPYPLSYRKLVRAINSVWQSQATLGFPPASV